MKTTSLLSTILVILINSQLAAQQINFAGVKILHTTGTYNTFLGQYAGASITTGNGNAFLGIDAGQTNTTGSSNTFMGAFSGQSNTTGSFNAFVGGAAGNRNTTGNGNAFLGFNAGYNTTTGSSNAFLGFKAGYNNTTGNWNVFLGNSAGYSTTTGSYNTFLGAGAGLDNTTGGNNTFLGYESGHNNTSGTGNVFMGSGSGSATTIGSDNTAIGDGSGQHNTTGQRNTAIGKNAGLNNQTGTDNVFIGYGAKAGSINPTNLTNAIAIGANAIVSQSNALILGNGANVGIGTSSPQNKLEINKGLTNQSGLRLTNLTSSSPATALNQTKFLTVNASGDVILGSLSSSARLGTELWAASGDHVQNTNAGGVIIGSGISVTPTGYKLYVEQGILAEKVKVAVKNTAEWSDKVFEADYALKDLVQVEDYIKTNKHLPGIPSAKEMVEQGNDLHQTDAKLLEKIEELTIYLIEQRKELQVISQQNRQIKNELTVLKAHINH